MIGLGGLVLGTVSTSGSEFNYYFKFPLDKIFYRLLSRCEINFDFE